MAIGLAVVTGVGEAVRVAARVAVAVRVAARVAMGVRVTTAVGVLLLAAVLVLMGTAVPVGLGEGVGLAAGAICSVVLALAPPPVAARVWLPGLASGGALTLTLKRPAPLAWIVGMPAGEPSQVSATVAF